MKTPKTKSNRPIGLNFEPEIENTSDEPLVEIEIPGPDAVHELDSEDRKKEAAKPLYLTRYE